MTVISAKSNKYQSVAKHNQELFWLLCFTEFRGQIEFIIHNLLDEKVGAFNVNQRRHRVTLQTLMICSCGFLPLLFVNKQMCLCVFTSESPCLL